MKIRSSLLLTWEMQVRILMRFHFKPTKLGQMNNYGAVAGWQDADRGKVLSLWGRAGPELVPALWTTRGASELRGREARSCALGPRAALSSSNENGLLAHGSDTKPSRRLPSLGLIAPAVPSQHVQLPSTTFPARPSGSPRS